MAIVIGKTVVDPEITRRVLPSFAQRPWLENPTNIRQNPRTKTARKRALPGALQ
jgi:hypothetical protein